MSGLSSGVTLAGMVDINNALEQFEHKVRKKILKQAAGKAAAEIRKDARMATPKGETGNLRKSVTSGARVLRKKNTVWGGVWWSVKGNKKGYHANWHEYGTSDRTVENYRGHQGVSVSVGKITPRAFSKPTFKKHKGRQIETFEHYLEKAIEKIKSAN